MKKPAVVDKARLPDPSMDGVDHINIHYNLAQRKLGRQLSTYFVARFNHPYFGPFKCIEGFKLYVETGCQDDEFRYLTGSQAKAHYRKQMDAGKLKKNDVPEMERVLLLAYYARLTQHPVTAALFQESTLPFEFYYLQKESGHPIRPEDAAELTQPLTTLRELMQQGQTPPPMSKEEYAKLVVR